MQCPHCKNDDESMIEISFESPFYIVYLCGVCSKIFSVKKPEVDK